MLNKLSISRALSIECWVVFNFRLNYNEFMKKLLPILIVSLLSVVFLSSCVYTKPLVAADEYEIELWGSSLDSTVSSVGSIRMTRR